MKYLSDIPRTAMEVYQMLPEGTLCEVIDNTLFMSPSPNTEHQRILGEIFAEMKIHLKHNAKGEVFISPYDVYLDNGQSVVQPDIVFVGLKSSDKIRRNGIHGGPDLVIEVLSTNLNHDKKRKFELYERNGIPEYIIIDPETKENWHYLLTDGKYYQLPDVAAGQITIRQLAILISY
jgi:Uma2 family endonuclease